jgi:Na+-transporting NADH:ubiquinone oxidoreductase subunit NqrA
VVGEIVIGTVPVDAADPVGRSAEAIVVSVKAASIAEAATAAMIHAAAAVVAGLLANCTINEVRRLTMALDVCRHRLTLTTEEVEEVEAEEVTSRIEGGLPMGHLILVDEVGQIVRLSLVNLLERPAVFSN